MAKVQLTEEEANGKYQDGISWFEAKTNIIRDAVRADLAKPIYNLNPTA